MRKILLTMIPLFGVALAKAEGNASLVEKSQTTEITQPLLGPGKNYRAQMARAYFGGGGKCRNWKRFCGR